MNINSLIIEKTEMIPLTLALSLQGRGDYSWFLPLEGRLRRLAEERGGLREGEMSILF